MAMTTLAAVIIAAIQANRAEQALATLAAPLDEASVMLAMGTDYASSCVSLPFFAARRRPLPVPWLPANAPRLGAQTPFGQRETR